MSGAVHHAPEGSLLGRLGRLRAVLRPPATGAQVVAVLDALGDAGLSCSLAGGWGVDALVGRQTRPHDDVDVVLDDFDRTVEEAAAVLGARGFRVLERVHAEAWMPDRWHLEDGLNCHVELVSLDLDRLERAGSSVGPGALVAYGTGTIEGRGVRCLSADAQWIVHGGYAPRPADRHDLVLLQELRSAMT